MFSIQQKVPRGCPRKNVFFRIRNISRRKQASGKKHAEHCLRHLNKTACEIWSIFDKVLFCVKYLPPFFHRTLRFQALVDKNLYQSNFKYFIVIFTFFLKLNTSLPEITPKTISHGNEIKLISKFSDFVETQARFHQFHFIRTFKCFIRSSTLVFDVWCC